RVPSLHPLRVLLLSLGLQSAACSTPISPYSPLEDFEEDDVPADAGVAPARDAGGDAGGVGVPADSGTSSNAMCARITTTSAFGSLFDDDCASRTAQACAGPGQDVQAAVNQRLANVASRCGAPLNSAIGVVFGRAGCPSNYGYDSALRGRIWSCIESELESWRLGCTPTCALAGSLVR
ncbi:MAG TPA: hypothetical protein VMF89_23325, partial [Polyangiales bacterium]|nr:hypothetical protein [Polyangiales bacterium]